ncbi:MAG: tRNA (adenosine(37)-N6)-threonylcarbamoyltransferase complex dimerization subunit type 1 TsaB [Nocardioidaceae bacterium]
MLLAFDTSTHAVTVAIHDGLTVLAESTVVDALRHGELLAPGIEAVLSETGVTPAALTRVVVGVGPGPFTGLRVGIVTARTMGAVLSIPVTGVCSLDVLAVQAVDDGSVDGPFVVATDARRKEVYWARYDDRGRRVDGPHVAKPDQLGSRLPVVGRGATLYPDELGIAHAPENPSAAVLAGCVVAERVPLLDPEPLYLRRPDVAVPGRRKSVS